MSISATESNASPIALYQGAAEYFPALVAAIDSARRTIYVESYLISDDAPTQTVLAALARARSRGVQVFVLLDGFGAAAQLGWVRAQLEPQGIEVEVYRPGFRWLAPHTWRRLHRKLVLVDERLGFVGGINLIGDQFDLKHGHLSRPRLDFAARVSAMRAVAPMSWSMRKLWWRVSLRNAFRGSMRSLFDAEDRSVEIRRIRKTWRRVRTHLRWRPMPSRRDASHRVRLLFRDNFRHRRSIENWYLQRIHLARREILLANAYFVPTLVFRQALMSAAQRGVRVRLLLQGTSDQWWTQWVTQALTDELLAAGIEIFEYQPSFLHAKVAVIDDWITVGSSNIDPFSLMMSLESNLVAEDARSAAQLRDQLEAALADSTPHQGLSRHAGQSRGLIRLLSLTFALMALRVFLAFTGSRFRVT
jgi:cardiolipin synthase A/B